LGHLAIAVLTVVRTPTLTLFLLPGIVQMMVAAGSFLVRDTPQRKEQDPHGPQSTVLSPQSTVFAAQD